jgi:hypothetical protein
MDDDLRALGVLLAKPGPSSQTVERGRHQLQQAILRPASRRRAMTGPSRTRRLAAGVGLTAAAAAAAIAALVPGGPLNTAPVRLSARQVLLAAATAAAAQPSSGAYWHVKEVYDFDQPPFGHPRGTWKWTRYTQETWTNRDGAFWVPDSAAGTGVVPLGGPGGFSVASSDLTFNQLQRLPESPAALKAWITHSFEHPAYAQMGIPSASVLPGYVLTTLVRLITDMPVPPAVRAAAFRALASMPNVTSLGPADGGQALLITGPPPPASSLPGVKLPRGPVPAGDTELIIDPTTAQVRSITTSESTETVIAEGWTNQMPKVDRVPPKKTDSKGLQAARIILTSSSSAPGLVFAGESLPGGLLGHAEGRADAGPADAAGAQQIDVVVHGRVELRGRRLHLGQAGEQLVVRLLVPHVDLGHRFHAEDLVA